MPHFDHFPRPGEIDPYVILEELVLFVKVYEYKHVNAFNSPDLIFCPYLLAILKTMVNYVVFFFFQFTFPVLSVSKQGVRNWETFSEWAKRFPPHAYLLICKKMGCFCVLLQICFKKDEQLLQKSNKKKIYV